MVDRLTPERRNEIQARLADRNLAVLDGFVRGRPSVVLDVQEATRALLAELARVQAELADAREALRKIAKNDHGTRTTSDPMPAVIDGKDTFVTYVERPEAWQIAQDALAAVSTKEPAEQ